MALQVRTQFGDLYLADALPAIRDIIQNEYDQYPDMIPNVYMVEGSGRSIEQSTGISGFGRFVETPEGSPTNGDIAYQRFDKTYTHLKYTLNYKVTREMIEDDQFGIVSKYSKALARSAFDTRQTLASDLYNEAFSATNFTGGDGSALCVTTHSLIAGTEQNTLTTAADLSVTSLRQALQDVADTTDDRGLLLNLHARYLLVPNELEWDSAELLKSPGRPDSPNLAANTFAPRNLSPIVWNYLTDPDAWFIICDRHDMHWYNRKPFTVEDYEDYPTQSMVVQGIMRLSRGWNDFRGIYGSPGA